MSMKPRITSWVVVLGFLLLVEIGAIIGILPISQMDVFWLVVTVGCLWAIFTFLLPRKETPKK